MKKFCLDLMVSQVTRLSEKYVLIRLTDSRPLPDMLPGQFVEVRVDDSPTTFLRRPISINFVDRKANELWLLVAAIGDGTRRLARLKAGDRLNCMLPLGNGFTLPKSPAERFLLVGGGVGVAPLLYLGRQIQAMGGEPTFLLGARSASDLLEMSDFEATGRVLVTTEDSSFGERGFDFVPRAFRFHCYLRTETDDASRGPLCPTEQYAVRSILRKHDGMWCRCLSVLRREVDRRKCVRMPGRPCIQYK